jgi:hypothetical protein
VVGIRFRALDPKGQSRGGGLRLGSHHRGGLVRRFLFCRWGRVMRFRFEGGGVKPQALPEVGTLGLTTLSALPRERFKLISNLDLVKVRRGQALKD